MLGRLDEARDLFRLMTSSEVIAFPEIVTEFLGLFCRGRRPKELRRQSMCYLEKFFGRVFALLRDYFEDPASAAALGRLEALQVGSARSGRLELEASGVYFAQNADEISSRDREQSRRRAAEPVMPISGEDRSLLLTILHYLAKSFSSKESQSKLFVLRVILKVSPQDLRARLEMSRVFTKRKLDRKALKVLDDLRKIESNSSGLPDRQGNGLQRTLNLARC